MGSIFDEAVVVSRKAFFLWWVVFLGVHLVTCGYCVAYALFYRVLNDTLIARYLAFYHVGMPRDCYGIIGSVHVLMALGHGGCVLSMVGSSLWLRELAFTPWRESNFLKKLSRPSKSSIRTSVTESQAMKLSAHVNSKIRNSVILVASQVTNRYGLLGVNGKYFHGITISRELVETALQTMQAYRMSRVLPSMLLNRFYVVTLVLNCWSSAFIHTLFHRNEARKRFTSLACDCIADLISSVGVTCIVVLSYIGQYDPETTDFGVNPWYNDEWTARAINEFQMVVVVSWSDLASRVIYSLGLVITTTNMKELLHCPSRIGNRVVHFSSGTPNILKTVKVKSNANPEPPSVQLLPGNVIDTMKTKISRYLMHGMHLLFFLWGAAVLGLHLLASVQSALDQCTLQVRPWAASIPYCFLVSLDCHRLGILGQQDEVDAKWREFDGSSAVLMVIKHCPLLDVPDTFNEFHQLISIKVYNSTIINWSDSAAITNTNHPEFLSLMLVRVNMTDGILPAGFQSSDLPLNLYDFEFCITDLRELPDDLDLKWFPGTYVIIEYSQLRTVPASLLRIMPAYFSLAGNPISELPPEIFEIEGLTDLGIGDTDIRELPSNVTQLSSTLTTIFAGGTDLSFFWPWVDDLLGRTSVRGVPRSIYAGGTVYCDDLERIRNESVESFQAFPSAEYSTQLMSVTEAGSHGLIWTWVDCNPTVSGVSGPLYPLAAEDANNAIRDER